MTSSFHSFFIAGSAAAAACSAAPGEGQPDAGNEVTAAAPKTLEGWSGLKFGMSLDEAAGQLPGVKWNPVSMEGCITEMAVSGCDLFPDRENSYLPLTEGALFLPSLSFNQKGQLTDVDLSYRYEGKVQPLECEAIHARTGDRLLKEFGQNPPKPDL